MQFLLCRSRELSAFISRFLSSLPAEYFAMFSCSFFRYFGSLVLASFSGRDIDQIFAQPQFYNHDYFPAKQQQREAENVNKLVSVLLCCTLHSLPLPLCLLQLLLPPIQTASGSSFFHQFNFAQCSPRKKRQCCVWWLPSSFLLQGILLKSCFYCVLMTNTSGPHKLPLVSSLNHPRLWILIRLKRQQTNTKITPFSNSFRFAHLSAIQ